MVVLKGTVLRVVWLVLQLLIFGPGGRPVVATMAATAVKRIDVHMHFVPPFYRDILAEKNLTSGGTPIPAWNATFHIEGQAKYNVQTSILSVSSPGVAFFEPHQTSEMCELARRINEYGHNLSIDYPGRLGFFATLPLPDVQGAIDEAVYSLDVLKAAGVILLANSQGVYLGNPKLDPLMEVLDERSAVAFVHPNTLPEEMELADTYGTGILDVIVALDFLLDTSRAATNLVLRNVTGRYPNIKFLLAHSGGFIPYAAGRLSLIYSELIPNTPREDFLRRLQTFYVDLGFTGESQLHCVLDFVPINQILFGSDWPSQSAGLKYVSAILDEYPLTSKQRYDINFGNAATLFLQ